MTPEQIDVLVDSGGWQAIAARVAQMIETHREGMEADIREEATWKLRGAISALRRVLQLPAILREEAEQQAIADSREPRRPVRLSKVELESS